jgi:hypothetical protein
MKAEGRPMELSSDLLPTPVDLRFYSDVEVRVNLKTTVGFSPEQSTLLAFILASPKALREMARMVLETDLAGIAGSHLMDKYFGPSNEDILNGVLSCLPESERPYWEGLRSDPGDMLGNEIIPVFFAFEMALKRTGIEDLAPTPSA